MPDPTISVSPSSITPPAVVGIAVNLPPVTQSGTVELVRTSDGVVVDSKPISANVPAPTVGLEGEAVDYAVRVTGPFAATKLGPLSYRASYAA